MITSMHDSPATEPSRFAPRFDVSVPTDGYRWWYVDGLSSDGRCGIVVIAFIGSVFSPYYYSARQRGAGDPENYCAINVGLYRPRGKLWAMTERGRGALSRETDWFQVGPSRLTWEGDRLQIDIRERSAPFARRMLGRVTVNASFLNDRAFPLDDGGRHQWRPIAPVGHIDVRMQKPDWRWQGEAYFDTNAGERALEDDFSRWNWSRATNSAAADPHTLITYAVTQRDGTRRSLALRSAPSQALTEVDLPQPVALPRSGWRITRETFSDAGPVVARTLEDAPFYSRSLLRADNPPGFIMHESLDLERFESAWVRKLLPFRMPRLG
jgi:carotenoid 1,2-hydratase